MSFGFGEGPDPNATDTYVEAHPYGSTGGQIFFSFIYMLWILFANIFILFLVFKDKTLRHQPHNIYVGILSLADITIGLYYLPMNMDFMSRGRWDHGCLSLGVFAFYPIYQNCFCAFIVFLFLFARLLSLCSCWRQSPMSLKKRFIFHGFSILIAMTYTLMLPVLIPVQSGAFRDRPGYIPGFLGTGPVVSHIEVQCPVLNGFDYLVRLLVILPGFWIPVFFSYMFLAIFLIKITRATAPEQTNQDPSKVPVKVLTVACLVSILIPTGYLAYLSSALPSPCVFLPIQGPGFTCSGAVGGLSVFLQWVMITKCGVLPLVWFLGEDYRSAARPIVGRFGPVLEFCKSRRRGGREMMPADPDSKNFDDVDYRG